MKKIIYYITIIGAVFHASLQSADAQNLEIFQKGNKYGLKSGDKIVVKTTHDQIRPLPYNYFSVKKDSKYGAINTRGQLVVPQQYDDLLYFEDGLFLVKKGAKWGIVDNQNRTVLSINYTGFKKIDDYLYEIKNGEQIGVISKYGGIIIPPYYDDIQKFAGSMYTVRLDRKWGIVNDIGIEIIPTMYDEIKFLQGSPYYLVKNDDKYGVIDLKGNRILDADFDDVDNTTYGFTMIKKGDKIGFFINNTYIPAEYDRIIYYQPEFGVIGLKKGNKYGFVTTDGQVVDAIYDNLSRFNGNSAFVEKNGRLMNINKQGKEINL